MFEPKEGIILRLALRDFNLNQSLEFFGKKFRVFLGFCYAETYARERERASNSPIRLSCLFAQKFVAWKLSCKAHVDVLYLGTTIEMYAVEHMLIMGHSRPLFLYLRFFGT